jgi:hypothetical protein
MVSVSTQDTIPVGPPKFDDLTLAERLELQRIAPIPPLAINADATEKVYADDERLAWALDNLHEATLDEP